MDNNCVIYYFSGTGNGVHIARKLGKELGASVKGMASFRNQQHVEVKGNMLGLVVPVYFLDAPSFVKKFVRKLQIPSDTFVFAIAHCGGLPGNTLPNLSKLLEDKGSQLNSAHTVFVPDNSIIFYTRGDKSKMLQKADTELLEISSSLQKRADNPPAKKFTTGILTRITEYSFALFGSNRKRAEDNKCTRCGLCAQLCPTNCISYNDDGLPVWDNSNCVYCFACIHWCPVRAIRFGVLKVNDRSAYRHPEVKATDIAEQKQISA